MTRTSLLPATLLALTLALPAQAAGCYADYKAKQDNPLRLHYGVAQISGACDRDSAASRTRPPPRPRRAGPFSMSSPYSERTASAQGKTVPDHTTSASDIRRFITIGVAAIAALLVTGAVVLFWTLPDANLFNAQVTRIFVENDDLTSGAEIKLLEILAQSGTAFSDTLASYRLVIFVLLVFAAAMLIAALVFLIMLITFNRRMAQIERTGIQVNSLLISREENTVYLNNLGFKLTDAAMETMSVLAEARMDDDVMSGSRNRGRDLRAADAADCDEAAGATRIKRLRDTLGNQIVSELCWSRTSRVAAICWPSTRT